MEQKVLEKGYAEGSERMLALVSAMLSGDDADKIAFLRDNNDLREEMFLKYNL